MEVASCLLPFLNQVTEGWDEQKSFLCDIKL